MGFTEVQQIECRQCGGQQTSCLGMLFCLTLIIAGVLLVPATIGLSLIGSWLGFKMCGAFVNTCKSCSGKGYHTDRIARR